MALYLLKNVTRQLQPLPAFWFAHAAPLYTKNMEKAKAAGTEIDVASLTFNQESGLTAEFLKTLAGQLPTVDGYIDIKEIKEFWTASSICPTLLQKILIIAKAADADLILKNRFFAVATSFLTVCLTHTMCLIFYVLGEGKPLSFWMSDFMDIYHFLANIDGGRNGIYVDGRLIGLDDLKKMPKKKETIGPLRVSLRSANNGTFRPFTSKEDIMKLEQAQTKMGGNQLEVIVVSTDEESSDDDEPDYILAHPIVIHPVPGIGTLVNLNLQIWFAQTIEAAGNKQEGRIFLKDFHNMPIENCAMMSLNY